MAGTKNGTFYGAGYNVWPTDAADLVTMQLTTDSTQIINVSGSPEGVVPANPGSLAHDRTNGNLWLKKSGTGVTLWEQVATGADVPQTFPTDSGVATPVAGVLNILGGPGVTTSAAGNTVTINSVTYTDQPSTTTITSNSGTFATNGAGIILNLPAAPTQGQLIEVVCTTANAVAIDVPAGDFIRAGSLITSSGGTLTSTAIGDAVVMRFNTANQTWYCTSLIGTWLVA